MRKAGLLTLFLSFSCWAGTGDGSRQEAEYYVAAYAQQYRVPVDFVRALIEQESGWHRCAISRKGAAGLMQLMPDTAKKLNVQDRCDVKQNISGGVRHLAGLEPPFGALPPAVKRKSRLPVGSCGPEPERRVPARPGSRCKESCNGGATVPLRPGRHAHDRIFVQ